MKRVFDIISSFIGLIFLLPVFAVVAVLIRIESSGPVFFVHIRIGKDFKPFNLYKFRTMAEHLPDSGLPVVADDDPRITRIGSFLRRTRIDELPQLINVLRGDMSLVGPMPEVRRYVSKFRRDYKDILTKRPGIIDVFSATYMKEEEVLKDKKDPEGYYLHIFLPRKIKLAREYIRNASFSYDLKIILIAIFNLVYPKKMVIKVINNLTPYRKPIVVGIQLGIFVIANYLAFFIRFDGDVPPSQFQVFLKYLPLLILFRTIFLSLFSLDKGLWKYTGLTDLFNILAATTFGSILFLLGVRFFFGETLYPRSVYIIDWFLNIFLLGGIRLLRRFHEKTGTEGAHRQRTIVIGAGQGAEMLLRDMEQSHYYPYEVIGLIDDNPAKKGLKIRNVPILGTRKELPSLVESEDPENFLIAMPSASLTLIQSIVKDLRQYGRPIKNLPGFKDILTGSVSLSDLKVMEPEDILFRSSTSYKEMDKNVKLKGFIKGRRVMITGAGGSIGSEISRQVALFEPESLILFERHEESLYRLDIDLRALVPGHSCHTSIIGDITDEKRVVEVMEKFHPEIVFHTAAYKHVPLMEDNPHEAFRTNVVGTNIVAKRASDCGVERFINISTDKAVNPTTVMGMTKKISEEIVSYLSADANSEVLEEEDLGSRQPDNSTKYITVRFGNVLESSGSVVPLFKNQIQQRIPVTVTHPEVTRYFMTLSEAANLVIHAAVMGSGGEVFVLDMGRPIKILDLAKRMITLYGYKPGVDIDISFTGLRPGEKLHEDLFNNDEVIEKTSHPKINKAVSDRRGIKFIGVIK